MARTIRFHLDEQVNPAIAKALRSRGIDVTTALSVGLYSADDFQHLVFAQSDGRVIFTHDSDFLRIHASGHPHSGIVYCHPNNRSIGQIVRALVSIWETSEHGQTLNRLIYI